MPAIATWNVNSLRARHDGLLAWLAERRPDLVVLQETKLPDREFPIRELGALGYHAVHHGAARYAGVAILGREPLEDARAGFTAAPADDAPRLLRATCGGLRLVTVYVPTRKAIGKVAWLDRLRDDLLATEDLDRPLILAGDFNICFDERDAYRVSWLAESDRFPDRVEDRAFRRLLGDCGLVDLFRQHHPEAREYSWFDYRRGAFARRQGLRLDYVFGNAAAARRCTGAWHDLEVRAMPRPSDHAPVWGQLG